MKQLLIPIVIGVLAGLGGGSGYAYVRASAKYAVDSARIADSLKVLPVDSAAAHADRDGRDVPLADSVVADSAVLSEPMTPADSLRALAAAREALKSASGKPNSVSQGMAAAKAAEKTADKVTEKSKLTAAPAATSTTGSTPSVPEVRPLAGTVQAANTVKVARDEALQTALPEQRLAKIFGAMAAKDAAKVMDQMTDQDVRAILARMNDRQAAAILAAFPAARAASITKGAVKSTGGSPE